MQERCVVLKGLFGRLRQRQPGATSPESCIIPGHESGVRRMLADVHRGPYQAMKHLADARAHPDGAVVLEGDWGGQIYVTAPASLVVCDESTLDRLLRDLDAIAWPSNDSDAAQVFYERHAVGSPVPGGMGGAAVGCDVWGHDEFVQLGLSDAIREVLSGQRSRIN